MLPAQTSAANPDEISKCEEHGQILYLGSQTAMPNLIVSDERENL